MTDTLDLPDYRDLDTDVADRFERIKNRPVVLAVDHLGKVFGEGQDSVLALKDIDFQVHRREFICVIGPSGCGKTTLLRILAGLDYPTSGQVLLDDERVEGPSPDRGMVFQGYTLFPWLTVKRNVMTYGYSSAERGFGDQLIEDLMQPLQKAVSYGELSKHPFGVSRREQESYARFLAKVNYQAVQTVSGNRLFCGSLGP